MAGRELPTVVVVAALPPPVHGQALVNAAVTEQLERLPISLTIVDTSPATRQKSLTYHLTRATRVLRAVKVLLHSRHGSTKSLYMPFEAGKGIIYNIILTLVSRLTGFRIILHHHSSAHTLSYNPLFAFLAFLCGPRAIHVALSERMAADLVAWYGLSGRTFVSTNACHVRSGGAASRFRTAGDALVVGLLANLNAEKGLDATVDTVIAARAAGENVRLVLAGPATEPEAVATIERARSALGDAVEVLGPVHGAAKRQFYESIDLFLFPTTYRYEAQPLVIYEALSYGIPVISTEVGYIEEMLEHIGIVVPIGSDLQTGLLAALHRFASNPEALATASRNSRREFERAAEASRAAFSELCRVISGVELWSHAQTSGSGLESEQRLKHR